MHIARLKDQTCFLVGEVGAGLLVAGAVDRRYMSTYHKRADKVRDAGRRDMD